MLNFSNIVCFGLSNCGNTASSIKEEPAANLDMKGSWLDKENIAILFSQVITHPSEWNYE